MKKCSKCGIEKNLIDFIPSKKCKDGTMNICRDCGREKHREWVKKNEEKVKIQKKAWAQKNPDKIKQANNRWRRENPESYNFKINEWRKKNPEIVKQYAKAGKIQQKNNNYESYKASKNANELKSRQNLSDRYLKARLKSVGVESQIINENPRLLELQRIIIKTKRLCKQLKN